jgi:hypothetical protein
MAARSRLPDISHADLAPHTTEARPPFQPWKLVDNRTYGLAPPIPDLTLNDARVVATLSFDKKPFRCVIPWRAVFGARVEGDESGRVWRADVPSDYPHADALRR